MKGFQSTASGGIGELQYYIKVEVKTQELDSMPVGMQFGRAGTMGDIKKRNEDVSDDDDEDSETRSHIAIK